MSSSLRQRWFIGSSIIPNRLNRTSFQCFLAGGAFNFVLRLFADVGIGVLERAREVRGSRVAADVAIDAGAVNIERAGSVFRHASVSVSRHRVRSLTHYANTHSFSVSVFRKTVAATRALSERGTKRSDSIM